MCVYEDFFNLCIVYNVYIYILFPLLQRRCLYVRRILGTHHPHDTASPVVASAATNASGQPDSGEVMLTKQQLICEPMPGKIHHAENNHCETKLRSVRWLHRPPKKVWVVVCPCWIPGSYA